MNIMHSKEEVVQGDYLECIFNRQKELMEKYHHIEERSGLLQTKDCPVNLNDKKGQARIKDFSWRITEEVGEALDAYMSDEEFKKIHFVEELIDGLHFLTELTILTGYGPKDISDSEDHYLENIYEYLEDDENKLSLYITLFIKDLGMMCNCLKNKPWKQTQMKTDTIKFYNNLKLVWKDYIRILKSVGLNCNDITDIYLKKSQVNKFRQRSNY